MNQWTRLYYVPGTVSGIFHLLTSLALTTTLRNCYNNSNHFRDEKIDLVMLNKSPKVTTGKLPELTSSVSKYNVTFLLLYQDAMQWYYLKFHFVILVIVIHHLPLSLEKHWVVEGKGIISMFHRSGNWRGDWTNFTQDCRKHYTAKDIQTDQGLFNLLRPYSSLHNHLQKHQISSETGSKLTSLFSCISGKEISILESWRMANTPYLSTSEMLTWVI